MRRPLLLQHDLSGFNFQPVHAKLTGVLDEIEAKSQMNPAPTIYVGSTTIDTCLPGFRQFNDLQLGARDALASIWIGNRTRIAAHYDLPDNVAVVAAGHRRFTLFPPDQLKNLYVGPVDFTPAGQAISLVDFLHPDFEKFPALPKRSSMPSGRAGTGRRLFIPSMWWHHIEALDAFNVLINYWWRQSPDYMDTPTNALMAAFLTMRDLPKEQRKAWQEIFRHYILRPTKKPPLTFRPTRAASGPADGRRRAPCAPTYLKDSTAKETHNMRDPNNRQPVRRVVICGGGTAGWMAAAGVSKVLGKLLDIKLIESEEIGTVGVGEATIPTLMNFHNVLEINEQEFMAETQATFKLGISFEEWRNVKEDYIHSFGVTGTDHWTAGFQHFWHKGVERGIASDYGDYCLELKASKENRFAHLPNNGMNYAYHLDAGRYASTCAA
jgi:hypothetical protein